MPGEDLALAIERRVVAVLADQHLGDEPRRRQALGNRAVGSRHLMDRATGAAAVFGAADAQDAKLRRHTVQHLAHALTDQVQAATAARTVMALRID